MATATLGLGGSGVPVSSVGGKAFKAVVLGDIPHFDACVRFAHVEGGHQMEVCSEAEWSEESILKFAQNLDQMVSSGWVHSDLKLSNIMTGRNGLVLIDLDSVHPEGTPPPGQMLTMEYVTDVMCVVGYTRIHMMAAFAITLGQLKGLSLKESRAFAKQGFADFQHVFEEACKL